MSIFPLPVFEADADPARRDAMTDEEIYARLAPPSTIVVRYGAMRVIGEFSYDGTARPGCGSKLVVRTPRGTEVAEMLTTTCGNSGCGKSVSRQEMLRYIEESGGRDFPFHDHGRVLRVADESDLRRWAEIQASKPDLLQRTRERVMMARQEGDPPLKVVDLEPIFGGETLTVHYLSEERIDFRTLVQDLASLFATRIEMRHVGARDEARLVADYERCGQQCCCRGFLKVLKPVSMKSAKVQKATLDPLKISGRCGRLMCCLRYEDQTYEELKKRLPRAKSRVGTSEGPGVVVDARILVQLVLVRLDADGREIAVPVEELLDPETCPRPAPVRPAVGQRPGAGSAPQRAGAARGAPASPKGSPLGTSNSDPESRPGGVPADRSSAEPAGGRRARRQVPAPLLGEERGDQETSAPSSGGSASPSAPTGGGQTTPSAPPSDRSEPGIPTDAQTDGQSDPASGAEGTPARKRRRRGRRRKSGDRTGGVGEEGAGGGADVGPGRGADGSPDGSSNPRPDRDPTEADSGGADR